MSSLRDFLAFTGRRAPAVPQRGLPDDDGNEYHGASAIGGDKPGVSEYQPRHTPTRTAISIPQAARKGPANDTDSYRRTRKLLRGR